MVKLYLLLGSAFCMLSVVLGAFAAHGLKRHVSEYAIGIFKTASEYQMSHGLALIVVAVMMRWGINVSAAGWLFIVGIVLFSGSLYLLALTGLKWLGPITPIGGVCLIAGWSVLLYKIAKHSF
ncbi:DUF423 domain-containing protein [Pseudoalteromonas aurantia]|uniref:DUF423 domain-containing protein n=1 Tax=Pseudoalteromonas aurantia TaxID=43654 RepID=A0A5S3V8D3_9GAMM|nr:DUF423 domain-containing protein [Pseudoalteromonas aurantia]TMO61344.1 DUF423 domain-containing protein [Pseudoalteromonas aurantia]TMO68131.1 DUF423 domain-containing protein [Pseudoalteromonas aurantia]TMO72265.1 DUF423 domain-containing protein [Pseudoalteromonas aurantia]